MSKRKPKPQAQSETAKRAKEFEAVSLQPDSAKLPRQEDIQITRAGEARDDRKVEENSARRLDAVEAIRHGMAKADKAFRAKGKEPVYVGCYDAARRLERDMVVSLGLHDKGGPIERVDGTPRVAGRMDSIIEASCQVRRLRAHISEREWWFWRECFTPTQDWPTWRSLVFHISGESHTHAQAAVVRSACLNLRDAYAGLERKAA